MDPDIDAGFFAPDAFTEEENGAVDGLINFFAEDDPEDSSGKVDFFSWGNSTSEPAEGGTEWGSNWEDTEAPNNTEGSKQLVLDDEIEF